MAQKFTTTSPAACPPPQSTRRSRGRLGIPVLVFAMFGMLFWTKLRLSVDVPKTAYATPDARLIESAESGDEFSPSGQSDHAPQRSESAEVSGR